MPRTDATHTTTTDGTDHTARDRRTARSRTLRIAAAALTAVAALTLTACGSQGEGLDTSTAKPFDPAPQEAADTSAKDAGSPAEAGGKGGRRTGADGAKGTSAGGKDTAATGTTGGSKSTTRHAACDAAKIRIVAKPVNRPVNHLLLEATNTSGATCDLYAAPYLRFDDAQSPLAELPDSKPQAVVTLTPGATGYAAVMTSSADGAGTNGHKRTSLTVSLPGRDGKGSVGGSARVALPGASAYIDDSAWVTYWQTDMSDALTW
ncbi:DUF4232 domain-containing protein [Streptomyces sp. NPDC017993]|uniref:DUF4232 domain-containing protein n=1 Tax=Streptomyces sp. NPDC017993 TaxID=3365027 RepID=UPI0037BBBB8C